MYKSPRTEYIRGHYIGVKDYYKTRIHTRDVLENSNQMISDVSGFPTLVALKIGDDNFIFNKKTGTYEKFNKCPIHYEVVGWMPMCSEIKNQIKKIVKEEMVKKAMSFNED